MSTAICVKCLAEYESPCPDGHNGGMLCQNCHQAAKDEIAARQALPVGGESCSEHDAVRDGLSTGTRIGTPLGNGGIPISLRRDARWRRYKHE